MYDIEFGDYDGFEIGIGITKEEREFFNKFGQMYGIGEFLGGMLSYKTIYRYNKKDKYIQFTFSCNEYWNVALDILKDGTSANRFYEFCCDKDKTDRLKSRDRTSTDIFFFSKIFSIDNWQEEINNLMGLVTC